MVEQPINFFRGCLYREIQEDLEKNKKTFNFLLILTKKWKDILELIYQVVWSSRN